MAHTPQSLRSNDSFRPDGAESLDDDTETSVLQPWVMGLTMMQQSVLLSAIRGADGFPKGHRAKPLTRFYRRSILISAFDKRALNEPYSPHGGNFTGPSIGPNEHIFVDPGPNGGTIVEDWPRAMQRVVTDFLKSRDELPLHYWDHQLHAFEIVGYKHPDLKIRAFWHDVFVRMVRCMHAHPETEAEMDARLSDNREEWLARSDRSEVPLV